MKNFTYFVLLSLLSVTTLAQTELITSNADFSNGSSSNWSKSGDVNFVGTGYTFCNSCPGYVVLGVDASGYKKDNAYGYLKRTFTIPSNVVSNSTATLEFYMYISTDEIDNSKIYDKLNMTLYNSSSQGYYLTTPYSNRNYNSGYYKQTLTFSNISDYANQSMTLTFEVDNDGAKPTGFRLDDFSFKVSTNSAQFGSLNVTLSPQDAINKGAQWRVDGGTWRNSGYTQPNLSTGSHNVEFSSATGYNTPSSKNINISANNTTTEYQTYSTNAEAKISVNVTSLDFTNYCSSKTKSFIITNTGNANLMVQAITNVPSNYSTDLTSAQTITPSSTLEVFVNFYPDNKVGTYSGNLTINSNASNGSAVVNLNGSCTNSKIPDLTIANLETHLDEYGLGDACLVSMDLLNNGNGDASNVTVTIWLSDNQSGNITNDLLLGSSTGSFNISSGGKVWVSIPTKLPLESKYLGTKYVKCWVDASDNINESNDNNNLLCKPITIVKNQIETGYDGNGVYHLNWPFYNENDGASKNPISEWNNQIIGGPKTSWYVTTHGGHDGSDLYAQDWWFALPEKQVCGMNFYSPLKGKVIAIRNTCGESCTDAESLDDECGGGYGNSVMIRSDKNPDVVFLVAHMKKINPNLSIKDNLNQINLNDYIGEMGMTGSGTGPHFHCYINKNLTQANFDFIKSEQRYNTKEVNACKFLFDATEKGGGGLGVQNENRLFSFNVFPNPSDGNFAIEYHSNAPEKMQIIIINTLGVEVYNSYVETQEGLNSFNPVLDVSKGVYTLIIKGSKSYASKKLLIFK